METYEWERLVSSLLIRDIGGIIMSQENTQLSRIKKSCRLGKIVSRIFFMCCVVATVITLVVGILMLVMSDKWEDQIAEALESQGGAEITTSMRLGVFKVDYMNVDLSELQSLKDQKVESSIPAVEDRFDQYPYSSSIGISCLMMAVMVGIMAFALFQISDAFRIVEEEETPFSKKVMHKLLVTMIIISVIFASTIGLAYGVIGGFVTWAVYTILDYGRTLQIQSDETL